MGLAEIYAAAVKDQLAYYCAWEPGKALELGDYGYLEDGIFRQKGNIKTLDIPIKERVNDNQSHKNFTSQESVTLDFGTATEVGVGDQTLVKATLKVGFNRENAIFFNAAGCTSVSIENKDEVGDKLASLRNKDRWDSSYVVVAEKFIAKSAQIAISKAGGSEINFEAESPGLAQIDLANADMKLKMTKEKNIGFKFLGPNVTLFQELWQLQKKNFWSDPKFKPKDADSKTPEAEYVFEKIVPK